MNPDFLHLYNEELRHIRERAEEFAADYPDVAARLALNQETGGACPDPFVERLLEGFAFLTARVRLKLDAEYPRFTQGILDTVYPDYMAPWPSAAIVQFTPKWNDAALLKGTSVPRLTTLESKRIGESFCTFRTAHEFKLYPFQVQESAYHVTDVRGLNLPFKNDPPAAFRIRLEMRGPDHLKMSDVECDRLAFLLHGKGEPRLPSDILENLFSSARSILVTAPRDATGATRTVLGREALRHVGFETDESMLPGNLRSFDGHRILREHFLLPQRNNFFEIRGLAAAFRKIPGRQLDIIITLGNVKQFPQAALPPEFVQLYCTPAINLFPVNANRISVHRRASEYQVLINRTRTIDHEVYSIESVIGFSRTSSNSHPFHPFYLQPAHDAGLGGYYTVFRETRQFSEREDRERRAGYQSTQFSRQRAFTSKDRYRGSEVFLSIVDEAVLATQPEGEELYARAKPPVVEELQVRALCTNRHLPMDLEVAKPGEQATDFTAKNMAQVGAVRIVVGPTRPRPSFAEGSVAWRAINHLTLNYLSLIPDSRHETSRGAEALRSLLRLYTSDADSAAGQALIETVKNISSKPGLARSPDGGPVAFIRGINIDLTLEDTIRTGMGVFPLASVLEQFFARHVSINHFTRLTLHTPERPNVMEWPARVGRISVC